jgi:hypothetical protein
MDFECRLSRKQSLKSASQASRIGQEQTLARQSFTSAFGTKQSLTRPMKIEYNAGLGCFKSPSTCESSNQKFRHLLDQ